MHPKIFLIMGTPMRKDNFGANLEKCATSHKHQLGVYSFLGSASWFSGSCSGLRRDATLHAEVGEGPANKFSC